jgi:ABC-type antimicrobial peptide transport system permease subunit
MARLSTFFAALALILAAIGLYGTLSYGVARRRREIGVRIALGAAPSGMLAMVLREAGSIVIVGIVAGLVMSIALGRVISSLLFELDTVDPMTVAVAGSVLALVAFAASAVPAWRAASTDALLPMREE